MWNKKAQSGPVSFIFHIIFFLLFIGIAGGTLWGLIGLASQTAGLIGLEAFIFDNFAMITIISALLGTMSFFYFGGNR